MSFAPRERLRIGRLSWKVVDLVLARPLVTSAGRFDARSVLVICAEVAIDGVERIGFGEAAPLRGWTSESVEECVALLEEFASSSIVEGSFDLVADEDALFGPIAHLPALRFGLELALLDALARHRGVPLRELLSNPSYTPGADIAVQFTLGVASQEESALRAREAVAAGFTCLKIKVGADSIEADVARIAEIRRACPDSLLRLDANGAFDAEGALRFARSVAEFGVDFIEQPLPAGDMEAFVALARRSPVDIAADESCIPVERGLELVASGGVQALVLKPTALGGLLPTLKLIDEARRNGVRVVLSTLIESAVGRRAVAHLAASRGDLEGPHGLATGAWFLEDLAPSPDVVVTGRLELGPEPGLGFAPMFQGAPLFKTGVSQ